VDRHGTCPPDREHGPVAELVHGPADQLLERALLQRSVANGGPPAPSDTRSMTARLKSSLRSGSHAQRPSAPERVTCVAVMSRWVWIALPFVACSSRQPAPLREPVASSAQPAKPPVVAHGKDPLREAQSYFANRPVDPSTTIRSSSKAKSSTSIEAHGARGPTDPTITRRRSPTVSSVARPVSAHRNRASRPSPASTSTYPRPVDT
jgi:hypothetical protein